jgi:REP element-mobilizing transposase RayT
MPDHWHALLFPRYPLSISRVVQDVKYVSARRLNRLRQTHGSLWEHQFWDRFVRHE